MTPRRRTGPRWYFSLRSPYSWLAHRQLTERHPDIAAALEWRPFWEPDARGASLLAAAGGRFPYTPMSKDKHLYILADVRRLARGMGLEPGWPVDRHPVWEVPHLAYLAAADRDRGPQFIRRAYEVRWQEGRDICDRAVMDELGAELGLPSGLLAGAADDDELRARGTQALLAVDSDGVFGVPFFVNGRERFWGVDRLDAFVRSLVGDPRWAPDGGTPATPPVGLGAGGDQGHPGGCG